MTRTSRLVAGIGALSIAAALFLCPGTASADPPAQTTALLSAGDAMAIAERIGEPVVATALTDEHTLVTADPDSGLLTADLSAGIARVRDSAGGWREPSASLVREPDGSWQPEAAAVPLTVSGGGDGPVATLGEGSAKVAFEWPTSLPAPTIDKDLATFNDVAPGVDLVVRANLDGVESFLVVKSAEAAQSPLVQEMPITATSVGLAATPESNGDITYSDSSGRDRFVLPEAYAWDSAGQQAGATTRELLDPKDEAALVPLNAGLDSPRQAATTTASLTLESDILDDPSTVFPVIIDPSWSMDETHALRVTNTFHKYDSDIGSTGKIGYNGWTSPYYKSRMFYQFKWPLNADKSIINSAQIASAEFRYKQTYSVQYDCDDHDYGPSIRVQPSGALDGDAAWADQPGLHWGSLYASSDYSVGQNCGSYTQKWNVTTMLQKERTDYSTRTTVTLRVASSDESDKNGWREYSNSSSSPDLIVNYEPEPLAPATFAIQDAVGTSPTVVTNQADPVLKVTAALVSGYGCRATTDCVKAELAILRSRPGLDPVVVKAAALGAQAVQPGQEVRLPVTGLTDGDFIARVRTYNVDTKLYSKTSTDFAFQVDLRPGTPSWSWVIPDDWSNPDALPADRALQLAVSAPVGDGDVVKYCVDVIRDGETTRTCSAATGGVLNIGSFERGKAQISVAAQDGHSTGDFRLDDPVERTFSW